MTTNTQESFVLRLEKHKKIIYGKGSAVVQLIARDIAGKDLTAAREFLEELQRFEAAEAL